MCVLRACGLGVPLHHRNKGLFSHWCLTGLSSATHASGAMWHTLVGGLVPGSFKGVWVVDMVPPVGLVTPSTTSVLSLSPPLGTLLFNDWLLHLPLSCKTLAGPLRRQPFQAPVRKIFLASTLVSGFGDCIWDGYAGGAVSGWPFLQSLLHSLSPFWSCI